jgi:transposase
MFLKRTKAGSKDKPITYLQLAKSYRDNKGKPRHKVIMNLGREEELINTEMVKVLAEKFASLSNELILIDKGKESFAQNYMLGGVLALQTMWKKLKLDKKLEKIKQERNLGWDFENAVKLMVLNRIFEPKSKLSTMKWKNQIYCKEVQDIDLHHLYKGLDLLQEHTEDLLTDLYQTSQSLFKPNVKIVFYDLTTIYFESQTSDELKTFGYSKDNKTDCVQVILSLAISEDNIPLYFDIYPGNTYEGHTVSKTIEDLRFRFNIEKIVLVGDKGILSKSVIAELDENGYEYIIASKLGSLPKKYHDSILDKKSYIPISDDLSLKEINLENSRLVLGFSKKRSKRDQTMRNTLLERISKKLAKDPKATIAKPSYKKYLSFSTVDVSLDKQKIDDAAKWDGFFGFITNNKDLTTNQILDAYRSLWQIEESFRCIKSTLDVRPVYHWTDKRIRGHIMMCYLSFYILRIMEKFVLNSELEMSNESIIECLNQVKAIKIKDKNKEYIARTEIKGNANIVLRALGCKIPSVIMEERKM